MSCGWESTGDLKYLRIWRWFVGNVFFLFKWEPKINPFNFRKLKFNLLSRALNGQILKNFKNFKKFQNSVKETIFKLWVGDIPWFWLYRCPRTLAVWFTRNSEIMESLLTIGDPMEYHFRPKINNSKIFWDS